MEEKQVTGLSSVEVDRLVAEGKVNKYVEGTSKSTWQIITSNAFNLPNIIIFTAVGFLIIYQQYQDALLISGIIFTNMAISILQEIQARNSLQKVSLINSEPVAVIRDGVVQEVDPQDLVLGDVIVLSSGKYMYVDGELLESDRLLLDESILTGESDYIAKKKGEEVLSGSFVVAGRGYYRATKVGADSFVNQVTQAARTYINYLSPLQVYVNHIVKILTYVTLFVIALLLSLNYFVLQMDDVALLEGVISIVTAMIPQGIVLTLTIAFTLGVIRMYRQKILVQKASAVETLAGIDVLCMDKTGTLTENKLVVKEFEDLTRKKLPGDLSVKELIAVFTAKTMEKNKTVLAINKRFGGDIDLTKFEVTDQLPFTSKSKCSGVEFVYDGLKFQLLLGPLDTIGEYLKAQTARHGQELAELDSEFARQGHRNLFFAYRSFKVDEKTPNWLDAEPVYLPMAFVSLNDTLRVGAKEIIESFLAQGVKPVVISGDNSETVLALTRQLDVEGLDSAISGKELAAITLPTEFEEAVLGHDIFARVTPEQKLQIIKQYQDNHKRVAMVGDGVNDALAVKQANLGISMTSGANVTKGIADVILLDDDLRRLADVMSQGREILFNTLRSAQLLLIKNAYSLLIIVSTLLLGLSFPLTPRGLFILAFLNTNVPVLVILASRSLKLPKISFMKDLLNFVIVGGILAGILSLGYLVYQEVVLREPELILLQTRLLAFLVLTGVINALYVLAPRKTLWGLFFGSKRSLVGFVNLFGLLAVIYITPLSEFFEVTALPAADWLPLIGLSSIYLFGLLLGLRWIYGNQNIQDWLSARFDKAPVRP